MFLGLAVVICAESIRLGVGNFESPGPGFLPLASGLVLGIFSLILPLRPPVTATRAAEQPRGQGFWISLSMVLGSLLAYAFLINILGFRVITFLWMGFVCWRIGKIGWKSALSISLVTTFSCYLLFEYYLSIRFPRGIWGF